MSLDAQVSELIERGRLLHSLDDGFTRAQLKPILDFADDHPATRQRCFDHLLGMLQGRPTLHFADERGFVDEGDFADDEPRTLRVSQSLLNVLAARIAELGLARDDLLFPSREVAGGHPLSRATFNTRYWRPAVQRSGIDFSVRMHDLRHAHASWLLVGGADLKSVMERMGHSQIMTTQKYLHTMPDAGDRALAAFEAVRLRVE